MTRNPERILVVRRDNIGDLVCTTPLFSALRSHYPKARICALVNSYNATVLDGNPDVDEIFVYQKFKHTEGKSRLAVWLETWRLIHRLRALRFDLVIIATPAWQQSSIRFARWIKAVRTIAYAEIDTDNGDRLAIRAGEAWHETQAVMHLLSPLGIVESPPPLKVHACPAMRAAVAKPAGDGPLIGIHVSARKPAQRWPAERFSELARHLHQEFNARFLLFWSPGAEDNPLHPGDDGKAAAICKQTGDLPLTPCPTSDLGELIAGLSACDYVVCSDGGGMHLAAGLGKPIVCFFGNSSAAHWHPWGVPYRLLQPDSQNVLDVSVDQALAACRSLVNEVTTERISESL